MYPMPYHICSSHVTFLSGSYAYKGQGEAHVLALKERNMSEHKWNLAVGLFCVAQRHESVFHAKGCVCSNLKAYPWRRRPLDTVRKWDPNSEKLLEI